MAQGAKILAQKANEKIDDIGEFGLIERIRDWLPSGTDSRVRVGIGDDTAVLAWGENRVLLATCDMLVENRHFQRDWIDFQTLGRRAVAINLSDIAAMGGSPLWALLSLGCPAGTASSDLEAFFAGLRQELAQHGALCVGGNLTQTAAGLVIDLTMLGEARPDQVVLRSGAHPGDGLFVSGALGAAAAGLALLLRQGRRVDARFQPLIDAQLKPQPRVALGRALAASGRVSAMIDISDGVAADLGRLCDESGCGAELLESRLPAAKTIPAAARLLEVSMTSLLLGGEAYELLFTVPDPQNRDFLDTVSRENGIPIHRIGTMLEKGQGRRFVDRNNRVLPLPKTGFDHFQKGSG
ncbi:thiamine-phosphate kinase [candidate division KSB1 bacterium]|nr:thiamine-phosphate kinase [candidate division KSB1 bacterium]